MPIEYPEFFFRLVRPRDVEAKFRAALNDPKIIAAVGVEDPRMIVEYIRDHTDDDELWMAGCKLFPLPDQHELFGFRFQKPVEHMGYLLTPNGIIDLGRPSFALDDDTGAATWVRYYRQLVHKCMSYNPAYRRPALKQYSSFERGMKPIRNKRGEEEWLIDQIVDATTIDYTRWYKVRWLGFGEDRDTWETRHNLRNCIALDRWEYAQKQPVTEYQDGLKITRRYVAEFPFP
ncbi:hypothetical protein EST38_g8655 [Candolleomyces aberdarensis]|uniref:Chromo domain-containing protein n=1 Tax=Candolleomyces aberdarensis TaxID=2316362 RepID=A0A4Q2DBZ0_9AGAR|nr:hypothetical protein EST38_g8655 [Candolleomyces aberdarensis]